MLYGRRKLSQHSKRLKQMDKAHLSVNLLNAILQYLGQRPYVEVAQLIDAFKKEQEDASEEVDSGSN
jgi:hypothetical protein